MKRKKPKVHQLTLKEQIKKNPGLFFVYFAIRLSVILVMIAQILNRDWENVFYCAASLMLLTVPSFIERNWHIDIPNTLEVIILLFIYAAEILGEVRAYYVNVPGWDTALHTITGFLAAAVGFSLVDIINRNENTKLYLSPVYVAIGAFCFSMTVAVFWEFLEFFADMFFGSDAQKDTVIHTIRSVSLDPTRTNKVVVIDNITETYVNGAELGLGGYLDIGLIDTMKDMFVNFIGAFVFSIIGFAYLKNNGRGKFAKRFIPKRILNEEEPPQED